MKYVVLQGDGMADEPIAELGGKTPLEYARTPNLDHMASRGILGLTRTIPRGLPPGSDVGTMSILGYDPARYHTGRSPIEAASMGVELGPDDRSEEHTSELQSLTNLVCRLLLEK